MGTHVKYNITIRTGSYEKDGTTKGKYKTVGQVMEKDDNSRFILIDPLFNFAGVKRDDGRDMIICSLMEPKEKESQTKSENITLEE